MIYRISDANNVLVPHIKCILYGSLGSSNPLPNIFILCLPVIGPILGYILSTLYGGPTILETSNDHTSSNHWLDHPPNTTNFLSFWSYTIDDSSLLKGE